MQKNVGAEHSGESGATSRARGASRTLPSGAIWAAMAAMALCSATALAQVEASPPAAEEPIAAQELAPAPLPPPPPLIPEAAPAPSMPAGSEGEPADLAPLPPPPMPSTVGPVAMAAVPARAAQAALATVPAASTPSASSPASPAPTDAPKRIHHLGVELDAGVPDGAGLSVLYRPWKFARVELGMLYNYVGFGIRGGVSVVVPYYIAPSLTFEAGHYFDGNASGKFSGVPDDVKPMLEQVGYTFISGQLGLEMGHPNWFVFFVRAGISRLWLTVHNVEKAAASKANSSDFTVKSANDLSVRLGIPNAKVGFMVYFY